MHTCAFFFFYKNGVFSNKPALFLFELTISLTANHRNKAFFGTKIQWVWK